MCTLLKREFRVSIWLVCSVAVIVSACTPAGDQDPSCTADDPDEWGNVVHWCDDGSHWWIDSDTGTRYDTDASGNTTTTETIDIKEDSTAPPQPTSVPASPSPLTQTTEPSALPSPSRFAIDPAQSKVSYGVGETFISEDNRYNYAVGVTTIVSGEILVDYENPAASTVGKITVDISAFKSDKSRRDKAIRDRWLQSSIFPLAVFSPTELRGLPERYAPGEVLHIEVAGDLLVRDIIRATVFALSVTIEGEQLTGEAVARVKMRDFGFDPPTVVGMIKAENDVDITFQFVALPTN